VGGEKRGEPFGAVGAHARGGRGLKVISGLAVGPCGQTVGFTSQAGSEYIIRARHNRRLMTDDCRSRPRAAGTRLLLETVQRTRPIARCRLTIPVRGGRPARTVSLVLRTLRAKVMRLNRQSRMLPPFELNIVDVQEVGGRRGEPPMRWALLTNRPVDTAGDAQAIVEGYTCRWRIEELHRTWKSGCCNVERSQLRSVPALMSWDTLLAAVAARIERIKYLSRNEPDAPALELYSTDEVAALRMMCNHHYPDVTMPDDEALTVGTVTAWLADMDGYVQTSAIRPPGTVVLSRGLERLQHYVEAMMAIRAERGEVEK
jgi:hypothetical protein